MNEESTPVETPDEGTETEEMAPEEETPEDAGTEEPEEE